MSVEVIKGDYAMTINTPEGVTIVAILVQGEDETVLPSLVLSDIAKETVDWMAHRINAEVKRREAKKLLHQEKRMPDPTEYRLQELMQRRFVDDRAEGR